MVRETPTTSASDHQAAQEQARFAKQLIEQHRTRGGKKSRYIAVATVREPDSKGAKSLMIFDTQADQVSWQPWV